MSFVAFDARFLFFIFDTSPAGNPTDVGKVQQLHEKLIQDKTTIVVPTPALSELLIGDPSRSQEIVETLDRSRAFEIAPFGTREACELAAIEAEVRATGDKRAGSLEPYQKIKFDRQICSIAKVRGCDAIYSADKGLRNFAESIGLKAISIDDLPASPEKSKGLFEDDE